MNPKLSILDQSAAATGRGQDATIRQTLELAQKAEAWGYHRFWVSEHHSHPSIVGSAPEVLMAAIAARTQRIRIGSAGVMLPHYAALKVAEQFRVLDALAPGRIDLGVGRAPGSDGRTAQLLNPDRSAAERFPQQVMELQAWVIGHNLPPGHPGHNVFAYPQSQTSPQVWMLGSSDYGAQLAAHLGLPYAFAYFITDGQGADEALQIYRESFRPSAALAKPAAALCVWALAADTDEEALRLFESRARWKMGSALHSSFDCGFCGSAGGSFNGWFCGCFASRLLLTTDIVVRQNEFDHFRVDHIAPTAATEDAVVTRTRHFQVLAIVGLDVAAQTMGSCSLT